MKLIRFNKETLPVRSAGVPCIRIYKAGNIVLTKPLVDLMQLTLESKIEVLQNEEAPKEWFIVSSQSEHALPLREYKNQSAGLVLQNSVLARTMLNKLLTPPHQSELTVMAMRIGKEPLKEACEDLWPIITSSYKEFIKNKD